MLLQAGAGHGGEGLRPAQEVDGGRAERLGHGGETNFPRSVPGEVETRLLRITDDTGRTGLRIEVHDAGDGRPQLRRNRPAPSLATRGRGLLLIDTLVGPTRWGTSTRLGIGKLVWATCFPDPDPDLPDPDL